MKNNPIGKIFFFWTTVSMKYSRLKNNPDRQPKDVSLGVTSIVLGILGAALTVGFCYLAFYCATGLGTWAFFFAFVAALACAALAVGTFVTMEIASIVYAVYQLRLNKKPIGIVSLILGIVMIIALAAVLVFFILQL